jgi:hypothetical protein
MFTHKLSGVTADYCVVDTRVRLQLNVTVEQHPHGYGDSR